MQEKNAILPLPAPFTIALQKRYKSSKKSTIYDHFCISFWLIYIGGAFASSA